MKNILLFVICLIPSSLYSMESTLNVLSAIGDLEIVNDALIIGGTTAAACAYGAASAYITYRISPEYHIMSDPFIALKEINGLNSELTTDQFKTLSKSKQFKIITHWGMRTSWITGVGLGTLVTIFARIGFNQMPAKKLILPISITLSAIAASAIWAGCHDYNEAKKDPCKINFLKGIYSGEQNNQSNSAAGRDLSHINPAFAAARSITNAGYSYAPSVTLCLCGWIVYKRIKTTF